MMKVAVAVGFVLLFCAFVTVVIAEATKGSRPLRYNLKKLIRTGRSDPYSLEYVLETEKRLPHGALRTGRSVTDSTNENAEPLTDDDFPIPYPAYYDFPFYRL